MAVVLPLSNAIIVIVQCKPGQTQTSKQPSPNQMLTSFSQFNIIKIYFWKILILIFEYL